MNIGEKIKEIRLKQNLKQSELAEKAKISRVAVGNYERGDRIPNAEILQSIAKALGVKPYELMYDFESLKEDEKITSAIEILLNHKGYKLSDFTEEEYQQIEKLLLEIIDLIAYKLNHK
ncbi:helix-turn-helix domain-containing protein [Clostridium sporogenes]|uniref:helix-turn-helix domain-containing protein n=1 Tax=Clostridium sporogenes TaxID=1509 RepID=UPI002237B279|nr:helix-turn-helix transcriptional regulator [Clostridium sporogenes]MCW6111626.1 helix-turn-helix domain-containing protein [Clostridium sporogenes]